MNGGSNLYYFLARLFYYILKGFPNLRKKLRFGKRFGSWFEVRIVGCWIRSSGEADAEEEEEENSF